MNINLSGEEINLLGESELLGGGLHDFMHAKMQKLGAKWHKLPKWAKILIAGSGIGLLSPTLMTTAITVGIPTALAVGPIAATIHGARKLHGVLQAKKEARLAAGQQVSADEQAHIDAVAQVAAQPLPENAPSPAEANAQTTALEKTVAPKMSPVIPIAGAGLLGLLAFLPKKH